MKKLILSVMAGVALCACNAQSGYKITGNVEGIPSSKTYLLSFNANQIDTLGSSAIKDGKFEFSGNVDGIKYAMIAFEGQRGGMPIFLENGNFTVNISATDPFANKVEGGAAQGLYNQFSELSMEIMKQQQPLQQAYMAANQAQDQAKMDSIENVFNQLITDMQTKELDLIKANPDAYVTAFMIAQSMQQLELEAVKERFALLSEAAQMNEWGKQISEFIAQQEKTAVGATAPDFTITDTEGKEFSLYSVKAKVKLLDFWASWCGPCRGENPNVVAIYKEYHDKGLEIVGISLDNDKEAWLKAIKDDGLIWKHGSDLKGWSAAPAQLYGVRAIPATFLLDENNKIVAKNLRGDALKAKIAEMLK